MTAARQTEKSPTDSPSDPARRAMANAIRALSMDAVEAAKSGKGEFQLTLNYTYCREGTGGLCKLGTLAWAVPVEISADADARVIRLPPK